MNILAFAVQLIINFYISPIVVSGIGTEAYGFIGLANDFTSYASILTSVFNSVAARFIATAYYNNDYESAYKYFNSLIVANLAMAGILGVSEPSSFRIWIHFLKFPLRSGLTSN